MSYTSSTVTEVYFLYFESFNIVFNGKKKKKKKESMKHYLPFSPNIIAVF